MTRSIEETLDDLEHIRNWFHEAPLDELEAVERAIERNAPIQIVSDVIADVWGLSEGYVSRSVAPGDAVEKVLSRPQERSEWFWFRTPSGDLILGCYPQAELYEEVAP